jgi:sialic acid synthase SpsE
MSLSAGNQAPVSLGETPVGAESPPVVLAEIGALFNRDLEMAARLIGRIAALRASGAGLPLLLKGEILHDPSICLDDDSVETYQSASGERRVERYRDLIERKTLSLEEYRRIFELSRRAGLPVVMSVYDEVGARFAVDEGAVALKIASSNITHLPLIRKASGLGVPLVIDSGRASLAEIDRAFHAAREAGACGIILEHSPDGHPAPPENHNLRTLRSLAEIFRVPVGLSDHFPGHEMMVAAIALGASVIERNVVEVAGGLDQDHAFASGIDRLEALIHSLHAVWLALGAPFRDMRNMRGLIATSARMGLVARHDVAPGDVLGEDTVSFAFPRKGIGAEDFERVAGWRFAGPVPAGKPIGWGDVRPA